MCTFNKHIFPLLDLKIYLSLSPPPPVPRRAHRLLGEDEAGDVDHVEEQVAHKVGSLGSRQLQAIAEPKDTLSGFPPKKVSPLITGAVHDGVRAHIGQTPPGLAGVDAGKGTFWIQER